MASTIALRATLIAATVGLAGLLAACNSAPAPPSTPAGTPTDAPTQATPVTASPAASAAPARVARTGASIPANGKPTLVFVDAIW